ncbi:hypothetical protein ZEAMMB73_Zm00001d041718 [Zea mays]|uniref:Uncharacterized protein n=1 Tax=Zea mays TaxID=4577 RepID=A0A1D6MXW0_MAIZE|nr:hypothetical protein ZEAMMB73_Zm00001d041718 [Zea mays]
MPTSSLSTSSRRVAADHSTAGVWIPPALLAGSPPASLSLSPVGQRSVSARTGPFLGWMLDYGWKKLTLVATDKYLKKMVSTENI